MANKFTQAQRDNWVDIQMQKAEEIANGEAIVYEPPVDLELDTYEEQIAAKEEEDRYLHEHPPADHEEYIRQANLITADLNSLRELEQQRQGRNEMRIEAARATHEAAKTAHKQTLDAIRTDELTAIGFKPPFDEREGISSEVE